MCPDLTMFSHKEVINLSWFVCSVNEPSGEIHAHRIMEAWDGGRPSFFCRPSGGFKNRPYLLLARLHFLVAYHLNSSRYHLVLLTLTFPSILRSAPEKRSNPDWDSFIVYFAWVVGEGAIWMILESSTKQYPTSFRESWGVQHLKTAPCPASQRQSSRGVLKISHIAGASPFLCPRYCGEGLSGRVHLLPS